MQEGAPQLGPHTTPKQAAYGAEFEHVQCMIACDLFTMALGHVNNLWSEGIPSRPTITRAPKGGALWGSELLPKAIAPEFFIGLH